MTAPFPAPTLSQLLSEEHRLRRLTVTIWERHERALAEWRVVHDSLDTRFPGWRELDRT